LGTVTNAVEVVAKFSFGSGFVELDYGTVSKSSQSTGRGKPEAQATT
jgi:hypothetical protein